MTNLKNAYENSLSVQGPLLPGWSTVQTLKLAHWIGLNLILLTEVFQLTFFSINSINLKSLKFGKQINLVVKSSFFQL